MASFEIRALMLRETGTYNDMAARPYVTDVKPETMSRFDEATRGGTVFSTEALAGVAGSVLRPRAEHEGLVEIDGGFGRERFRFIMEIEHPNRMGAGHVQIVTGYTDTLGADVSHSGNHVHINPSMRFFINSVLTMRNVAHEGADGRRYQNTVFDNSHVLSAEYSPSIRRGEGNTPVRMRPEDTFAAMAYADNALGGGGGGWNDGMDNVLDLRASFADGTCKSRRSNSSATSFLSTSLTAYRQAANKAALGHGDRYSMLDSSRGTVAENMISDDMFLGPLQRETSLRSGSSLSYRELLDICPHLDDITDVVMTRQLRRDGPVVHRRGDTEEVTGADYETVAANALAHSVPSIMMDLMITQAAFRATNRTLDGSIQIIPGKFRMFRKDFPDPEPYLDRLFDRLQIEVFRDLTRFNRADFDVSMNVNVFGDTSVTISVNGSRPETFVMPSFCDSLFVPVLGRDTSTLSALASDMNQMADMVKSSMSVSAGRGDFHETRRDSSDRNRSNNQGYGNYASHSAV